MKKLIISLALGAGAERRQCRDPYRRACGGVGRKRQGLSHMQSGTVADIAAVVDNCSIALQEADHHFLPDMRDRQRAPMRPGRVLRYANPA